MYADDTSVGNTSRIINDIKTNLMPDLLSVCDWLKGGFPVMAETTRKLAASTR